MSQCDPNELMTSAACFACLPPDQLDAIQTELLCRILQNEIVQTGPAGADGAVQYNNGGVFGGDATNFFWDDTNNRLGVGFNTPDTTVAIKGAAQPLNLWRDSQTNGQGVGVGFQKTSSAGSKKTFAAIFGNGSDHTDGSEVGFINCQVRRTGTLADTLIIRGGGSTSGMLTLEYSALSVSTAGNVLANLNGPTNTSSSSTAIGLRVSNTYNQTSTAASNDLLLRRVETALGSGSHRFIECQGGAAGSTVVFQVRNLGEIRGKQLELTDGITEPSAITGQAIIYVDVADGDLKVKFADGVTKTLAVDT